MESRDTARCQGVLFILPRHPGPLCMFMGQSAFRSSPECPSRGLRWHSCDMDSLGFSTWATWKETSQEYTFPWNFFFYYLIIIWSHVYKWMLPILISSSRGFHIHKPHFYISLLLNNQSRSKNCLHGTVSNFSTPIPHPLEAGLCWFRCSQFNTSGFGVDQVNGYFSVLILSEILISPPPFF